MKTRILNISILLLVVVGVLQLATSQIHIQTITQLFTREVGFFLFFYLLLGLVLSFTASGIKRKRNFLALFIILVLNIVAGVNYITILFNDLGQYENIKFEVIRNPLILVISAMAIYVIGFVVVFYLMKVKKVDGDIFATE